MMALKSPMIPSPNGNFMSAFSPYSDSPTSPARFDSPIHRPMSTDHSSHLHPPNPFSPLASSPSDIADPSPISSSSNDTDTTNIDETEVELEESEPTPQPPKSADPETKEDLDQRTSSTSRNGERASLQLETKNAAEDAYKPRSDDDEQPSSVIHAPQGFDAFHQQSPPSARRTTPTPSQTSDPIIVSPPEEDENMQRKPTRTSISPPPIQTTVPPARDWSATPRAQTRPEAEAQTLELMSRQNLSRSSSRASNLEDIPEAQDIEENYAKAPDSHETLFDHAIERFQESNDEVSALKIALSECWTLCNTLAGLSYIHRERIFSFSGKGDRQEQAWKSCWKLCQNLYETRDEEIATQVRPTLDLCRDFCQCLFEVRQRENDKADSVLRVSFELNNHLYNTHDRTLPEAFRERTLDFYITLCHRLMKQRSELARETESLLGACWSLAEMLFSLRQNKRDGKPADEELLGSAVQACWELCDLFREGWTQVRPDRGTPRPSQTTFTQAFQQAKQSQIASPPFARATEDFDESEDEDYGRAHPETPTTVFEDTVSESETSPEDAPPPNILVLGPPDPATRQQQAAQRQKHQQRNPHWSSNSSTLSGYSSNSKNSKTTTSSTSTIITPNMGQAATEDPHLTCLKLLIIRAALNIGYQRPRSPSLTRSPPHSSSPHNRMTLAAFVKTLPSNSFGTSPWQIQLLDSYKKLIASDPSFSNGALMGPVRRARAADVARSVRWMVGGHAGRYTWLRDLYRLVFGFRVEEGEGRAGEAVLTA